MLIFKFTFTGIEIYNYSTIYRFNDLRLQSYVAKALVCSAKDVSWTGFI